MCGIFGFCGTGANPKTLMQVAKLAGTRGPNAHGIAWTHWKIGGAISYIKREGRIKPETLLQGFAPPAIIGHCRLSTSGDYHIMENNQPIGTDGIAVAHNGNIEDCGKVAAKYGIELRTQCDSEVLAGIAEKQGLEEAIKIAEESPMAVLFLYPDRVIARRKGIPLYAADKPEGTYFCSRKFDGAELIPEEKTITIMTGGQGKWR